MPKCGDDLEGWMIRTGDERAQRLTSVKNCLGKRTEFRFIFGLEVIT